MDAGNPPLTLRIPDPRTTMKRTLIWENFIQREQIRAVQGRRTMVIRYESEGERDEVVSSFERCSVGRDPPLPVKLTSFGTKDIHVELHSEERRDDIWDPLIDRVRASAVLVAEVRHGNRYFVLEGTDGSGDVRVGNVNMGGGPDHSPYKFFVFRQNGAPVARALVGHCEKEMLTAPTIELLEVVRDLHLRGLGTQLVGVIENEARAEGFDRIWANNISRAVGFWERLDYEVIAGDGTKAI